MTQEDLNLFELDFEYELLGDDLESFKAIVADYIAQEPTENNNDDLRRFFFNRYTDITDSVIEMITYAVTTLEFGATAVPLTLLAIRDKVISNVKAYKKTDVYKLMNDETIEFYRESEKNDFTTELTNKALQFRDRTFIKEVRTAIARMKGITPIKE